MTDRKTSPNDFTWYQEYQNQTLHKSNDNKHLVRSNSQFDSHISQIKGKNGILKSNNFIHSFEIAT